MLIFLKWTEVCDMVPMFRQGVPEAYSGKVRRALASMRKSYILKQFSVFSKED